MKTKRYRIVGNPQEGFIVEEWRLWWPFWVIADDFNIHDTKQEALEFALQLSNPPVDEVDYLP